MGDIRLAVAIIVVMTIVVSILVFSYCRCLCQVAKCSPGCECAASRNASVFNPTSDSENRLKNKSRQCTRGEALEIKIQESEDELEDRNKVKTSSSTPVLNSVHLMDPPPQLKSFRASETDIRKVQLQPSTGLLGVPGSASCSSSQLNGSRRFSVMSVLSTWRDHIND